MRNHIQIYSWKQFATPVTILRTFYKPSFEEQKKFKEKGTVENIKIYFNDN